MMEASEIVSGLSVEALPRKKGMRAAWKEFKEFVRVSKEQGDLVPVSLAAKLLGVTETRIGQLVEDGALGTWSYFGRRWLSATQLTTFVKLERPSGIPTKKPTAAELVKMSVGEGMEIRKQMWKEVKGERGARK